MPRSRNAEPIIEPKKFASLDEIDRASVKLRRRISEVVELQLKQARYNAPGVYAATSNIRKTILEIFGPHSPEYAEQQDHIICSGSTSLRPSEPELQEAFEAGIPHTIGMLEGLVKRLEEGRLDFVALQPVRPPPEGGAIFIGHGRSREWLALQVFLQDRLKLTCVEFNSESVAGVSTQERLSELLGKAGFAFLLMTAEDEQPDGSKRTRENVVHEAGLFQGRLSFRKAIVLLEHGCMEFSNIHGLGQIRFPKGQIDASFEEVRKVLERENILKPSCAAW